MDEARTAPEASPATDSRLAQAIEVLNRRETSRLMTVLLSLNGTPRRGGLVPSSQGMNGHVAQDAEPLATASHSAGACATGMLTRGQASRETEPKDNSST